MHRAILALLIGSALSASAFAAQGPTVPGLEKAMAAPPPPAAAKPSAIPCIIPDCPDKPPPPEWSGAFDLGANGTDGNANTFSLRFYTEAKHERADSIWTSNLLYNYSTAESVVTQQYAIANSRYDWLFADSPWSYFVSGGLQYDQFRAFDLLLFAHTGFGYTWFKDDSGFLKTRAGVGGSYPIGGPDEKFTPEALLGVDYERKLFDRTKFVFGAVVFPDLSDFFEYRATVTGAIEVLVSPEYKVGLKTGFVDNYISQPQGRRANDLSYFVAVTWKF